MIAFELLIACGKFNTRSWVAAWSRLHYLHSLVFIRVDIRRSLIIDFRSLQSALSDFRCWWEMLSANVSSTVVITLKVFTIDLNSRFWNLSLTTSEMDIAKSYVLIILLERSFVVLRRKPRLHVMRHKAWVGGTISTNKSRWLCFWRAESRVVRTILFSHKFFLFFRINWWV